MSTKSQTNAKTAKGSVLGRVELGAEHYAQQLEALHQIGLEILEHAQPDQIIERALELIVSLVDSDGGGFWIRKSSQFEAWNEFVFTTGKTYLKPGTRFEIGQGMVGEVFETGEAILIDDFLAPQYDGYPFRPVHSLMLVPLKRANIVTGVFLIANANKIAAFDRKDLQLLERFAILVSIALENARLLEEAKASTTTAVSRAEQLEALHVLSLELVSENNPTLVIERALKLSMALVGADDGGYWRFQKPEQAPYIEAILASENLAKFIGIKIDYSKPSLTGLVLQTGRAVLIEDYQRSEYRNSIFDNNCQSLIAVPLWQ